MLRPKIQDPTDLVLVGAGHTHVQVLKSFAMDPPEGTRITVVADTPIAVYSGMVPGFVAGQYRRSELEIDALPLARLAGARFVQARALALDPVARRIELAGRPAISYDVASFDIGSTVAGLGVPGVREHALATRPIGRFVEIIDDLFSKIEDSPHGSPQNLKKPIRVLIVGGGAAGVELAFTLEGRLSRLERHVEVALIESGDEILAGQPSGLRRRILAAAGEREIELVTGERVVAVHDGSVRIETDSGSTYTRSSELVIWVTGAFGQDVFRRSKLPTDDRGFVRVRSTLQVEGYDELFAVGDCAHLIRDPKTPKAGVYAVRQGPTLTGNLRRAIAKGSLLEPYRPQRDFLALLNLGDGTAVGAKWGASFAGAGVFHLKDRIDRRFMRQFQVLTESGAPRSSFEELAAMRAEMDILCGGCAAKLGQKPLARALGRLSSPSADSSDKRPGDQPGDPIVELGVDHADDVAAYRSPNGQRIISSVDQFRPFTDDSYLVGRVGAVNAASDILAKGVDPVYAQALVALPESASTEEREETLFQVLAGARDAFDELGVAIVGGHTTTAANLLVGFQVEAFAGPDEPLLTIDQLRVGDHLILSKPLGTGVLFHADMKGRASGRWFERALDSMLRPNTAAARVALAQGAAAATDISGFGLAGHLAGMLKASSVAAVVSLEALPALPGSIELLSSGLRSTFHETNAGPSRGIRTEPAARHHPRFPLLFDPQTSGGLLFGVRESRVQATLEALVESGDRDAAVIGLAESTRDHSSPLRVVVE